MALSLVSVIFAWLGCGSSGSEATVAPDPAAEAQAAPGPAPTEPAALDAGDAVVDGDDDDVPVTGGGGDIASKVAGAFTPAADPCAANPNPGLHNLVTEYDGKPVRSLLYVPPTPGPHDLVVLLHAGGANPARILVQTHFHEQAEKDGFVLLVPPAADVGDHGPHWASGKFDSVATYTRDDVAMLDALTADIKVKTCATQRTLTAGFSSGGQMAQRWGCEGKEPDAVLTAAGELIVPATGCKTQRPVRGYVGTLDKVYEGSPLEGAEQPSAQETMELWAKIDGCDGSPPTETVNGPVTCKAWNKCAQPVELCILDGFPHGWPGPWNKRKPTTVNATEEGMAWFRQVVPIEGTKAAKPDKRAGKGK